MEDNETAYAYSHSLVTGSHGYVGGSFVIEWKKKPSDNDIDYLAWCNLTKPRYHRTDTAFRELSDEIHNKSTSRVSQKIADRKNRKKIDKNISNSYKVRQLQSQGRDYLIATIIGSTNAFLNSRFWPADVPLQRINISSWPTTRKAADFIRSIWHTTSYWLPLLQKHGYTLTWSTNGLMLHPFQDRPGIINFGSVFTHIEDTSGVEPINDAVLLFPYIGSHQSINIENAINYTNDLLIMRQYPITYSSKPLGVLFIQQWNISTTEWILPFVKADVKEGCVFGTSVTKDGLRRPNVYAWWPPLGFNIDKFFSYTCNQWKLFLRTAQLTCDFRWNAIALVLGTGTVLYDKNGFYSDRLSIVAIAFVNEQDRMFYNAQSIITGLVGR